MVTHQRQILPHLEESSQSKKCAIRRAVTMAEVAAGRWRQCEGNEKLKKSKATAKGGPVATAAKGGAKGGLDAKF